MTVQAMTKEEAQSSGERIVNDFSMTVATMNGSGSQTSNLTLLRAMFKMGIPVSGKNLFPSNIQGLPTWYTIRASKDGYLARRETHEIIVAMNADTFGQDLESVVPGGAFYYGDHLKFEINRDDIAVYTFPAKKLAKDSGAPAALRDYVANMAYVGVLAHMIGIDMEQIKGALDFHFSGKEKPIALNMGVIEAAAEWAAENLEKQDPYYVEAMDGTEGKIMADGNTAAALGAIFGGVQFASWYPITPASSVAEALTINIGKYRDDLYEGGKTYAIIQSEDELAAIGMALGAGWAGLRSMTSTSGPGISLMTEFAGLAYYSETPVVIWDVQRVGPSTGLPTRTAQGDITQVAFLGHGDTHNIMLFPACAQECFEFGWKAFDIAERVQAPVFVMSDLDLGMNQWMTDPFEYPDVDMDRGKVVWEQDLENWEGRYGRYLDKDGDGIPYRTVPGNKHPKSAWFARGTGHDEYAAYTERGDDWEHNMERLIKKYDTARQYLPESDIFEKEGATIGIIAYGSTHPAIEEACDKLEEDDLKADYLRLRSYPFRDEVQEFIQKHDKVYVVEMNRDGQMHQLLSLAYPEMVNKLVSITKHDGLPLNARWTSEAIQAEEN
ncbi:MAG: 2-oxoacid:acceptor oxidoreductase subunit alpha [Chloroflexi bacterium]|nr:MAG: 2-oxoacid:acceptor oxidoreductase subunit alpha [Chloroflexota bacterium]MBL1194763.1 2-oxoacid:acceptor oxidoreductase subunit alpha [Chloroflexota bacterium]NOH12055.1 2-oxoacid:acceptor oxidoreductase subunit alpha [Chloroflexota bacterium]